MKSKYKLLFLSLLAASVCMAYFFWIFFRSVDIIAVHQRTSNFSAVLVNNFPLTDRGKINWWLKNKSMVKKKYGVPDPELGDSFHITFFLFGDGYKEEGKYDRLCFSEMKTQKNCIEKEAVFSVSNSKNRGMIFNVYEGTWHQEKDGSVVKLR